LWKRRRNEAWPDLPLHRDGCMVFGMSRLTEIETVVDRLSLAEQEELLRHLEARLRRRGTATPAEREEWMRRLDALRDSIAPGPGTVTSDQILDELRDE
jgi:hypothetical protein